MLSLVERQAFDEKGIVSLPGALDPSVAMALRDETYAWIAKRGLAPESRPHAVGITASKLARIGSAHGFAEVWGARVLGAIDEILGRAEWLMPKHAGQVLHMPWPETGVTWRLPHSGWHLDYRAPGGERALPGLQLFLCVDRIESHGAATLVAAGTARLIDGIRRRMAPDWPGASPEVRKSLRREVPWFRELCSMRPYEDRIARFVTRPTAVPGGSLQVVELTGAPGDVWLMHPWMVHALSPNCAVRPRLALTERVRSLEGMRQLAAAQQ